MPEERTTEQLLRDALQVAEYFDYLDDMPYDVYEWWKQNMKSGKDRTSK